MSTINVMSTINDMENNKQNKEVLSKSQEQENKTRYQPPILVVLEVGETESGFAGQRESLFVGDSFPEDLLRAS